MCVLLLFICAFGFAQSESARRYAYVFFENVGEIAVAVEPCFFGNFRNRKVRFRQHFTRFLGANGIYIAFKIHSHRFMKHLCKIRCAHKANFGAVLKRNIFVIVFNNIFNGFPYSYIVLAALLFIRHVFSLDTQFH